MSERKGIGEEKASKDVSKTGLSGRIKRVWFLGLLGLKAKRLLLSFFACFFFLYNPPPPPPGMRSFCNATPCVDLLTAVVVVELGSCVGDDLFAG